MGSQAKCQKFPMNFVIWSIYVSYFIHSIVFSIVAKKVGPNFRRLALTYGYNKHDSKDWEYLWDVYRKSSYDGDRRFLRTSLISFHEPKLVQK